MRNGGRFLFFPFAVRVVRRFAGEGLGQASAALAFTTLLSLVPMAALLLALVAAFPEFRLFVEQLDRLLVSHLLPAGSAGLIAEKILQFSARAADLSGWGAGILAVTAFLLVNTVEHAFNRIWRVREPRPVWRRLFLHALLVAVWPLVIGALLAAVSSAITASFGFLGILRWVQAPLFRVFSLAALILFLGFIYHAIPNARVRWRDALIAGAVAAFGFLLLQWGFNFYLTHFASYRAIYGAFAAMPIFLIWVYLSWAIVLLGALVAAALPGESVERPRRFRR